MAKGTTSTTISNLILNTTYEIVVQAINSTDTTKISTGIRIEVITLKTNQATAPADVSNVTVSTTDTSARISWTAPTLNASHKKADGTQLTTADVSYKVYRVTKNGLNTRTEAQIIGADTNPIEVAKGTTSINISNLTRNTTYEIVVQAINTIDTTKVSTGMRAEVTTLTINQATAPAEVSSVTENPTDTSARISWAAPVLTDSHKKADGTQLTTADVSYKVYRVAKNGATPRTEAQIIKADTNPIEVAKGTTSATIGSLTRNTTYEIVVQAINATDTTKVSTGVKAEVTTLTNNQATAPADASSVTASSVTNNSARISWTAPTLTDSHKKADGTQLTQADVSYKIYRIAKNGATPRTEAQVIRADTNPIAVAKGTTSTTISNLTGNTTYEIVVQSVNSTDTTKVSAGVKIEAITTNPATAPADASSVTASSITDNSARISWTAPTLNDSHKKADGQALTQADVSYKIYRVAKNGSSVRSVANIIAADKTPIAVAKGTTSTTISNLTGSTTYEIVVQAVNATDTTKASAGVKIEATTTNPANAPANVRSITVLSITEKSAVILWSASALNDSHKKANGQRLTAADVSYKVYRVAKDGANTRSVASIIEADKNPIEVVEGTTFASITNLKGSTTYEIVVQAINATDTTKISTGSKTEVTTTNPAALATAPAEVTNITASSITDNSARISWTAPTLGTDHKKADGARLTVADVSYKVYHVAKNGANTRSVVGIIAADRTPIAVAKGTTSTTISNLRGSTTYEIVVQAVNTTDTTKVSTGVRREATTTNPATAPADVSNVTGSLTDNSARISWRVPVLTNSHKKADGTLLTAADVSYKVYHVAKNGSSIRSVANIIAADRTPIAVTKGTTNTTISNLTGSTTYEIVVQAINSTDTTKISAGVKAEVTTTNPATAPADASSVTASSITNNSARISWAAPVLTNSHKKANGQTLTTADVAYKVYHVAKGGSSRTIASIIAADTSPIEVAKGTTSTTITSLTGSTIYEIVVRAVNSTDTTKISAGVKAELTTLTTNQATAPAGVTNITASSITDNSAIISWTAPTLNDSHKKTDGQTLTTADVSYKVYRVAKNGVNTRTAAQIIRADSNPIAVAKGTTSTTISNLRSSTIYEIAVQAVNSTDTTKVSTGVKTQITTTNQATAPAEVTNVTTSNITDNSVRVSWTAPVLNDSHKKANGQTLTTADVSYKVYRVAKNGANTRTAGQIISADKSPIEVAKGTTSTTISNLTGNTTYEIAVQAINSTDITKISAGVETEVTTTNPATAPAGVTNVTASSITDNSARISWTAPVLNDSHKKANGQTLTTADVSYKIYQVAKNGANTRTAGQIISADKSPIAVTKGTTSTTVSNLIGNTTYEIVVQAVNATDTTKVSAGVKAELTTTNPANAPAEVTNVTVSSITDNSAVVLWKTPVLNNSHKKASGQTLTKADVSYKVYRVAKNGSNVRSVAGIIAADNNPIAVAKGTTDVTITNLIFSTTYEIVVRSVNATDTTKISAGIKAELTTANPATAPAEVTNITTNALDTSARISWTAPMLTSSHKKLNGQRLTAEDVSYKVYRVTKNGSNVRSAANIIAADTSPIAVSKGTTNTNITNLTRNRTYEIVVQAVNSTDTKKVSTGVREEVTTLTTNQATAPAEVTNVTALSITDKDARISWTAPALTDSYKKADGTQLTQSDVSYKVYRVAKNGSITRSIAQIIVADNNPIEVAKGTTNTNISNLTFTTTYEIVIQAVNTTDTTKVSTGVKIEITTANPATAPAEVTNITKSSADTSVIISWTAPVLTDSHKKADGTQLTQSDVSYKVYRVAKDGVRVRTIASIILADKNPIAVAQGTIRTSISNLMPTATYEIVVQAVNATDTIKVSTGVREEVTTLVSINMIAKQQGSSSRLTTFSTIAQEEGSTAITPIVMEVTPSSAVTGGTFSITPNITKNTRLAFNTSNGTISGVAKYQPKTTYTIKFTARDGRKAETSIDITVVHKYTPKNRAKLIEIIKDIIDTNNDDTIDAKDNLDADLNLINTSKIKDMSYLFSGFDSKTESGFSLFNGDISKWDVSKVTNMISMFRNAATFNGDISNWDVSNVTTMNSMFRGIPANADYGTPQKPNKFNRDISNWDVSNVLDMAQMFQESIFAQNLEAWGSHIGKNVFKSGMFTNSKVTKLPSWY